MRSRQPFCSHLLDDVAIGATIYITDLENIYTYTATSTVRVQPTDVYLLDEVAGEKK